MRKIKLPQSDIEQLFKRMIFDKVAKNCDDHIKNISFFMNRDGVWRLAPAYDMTFSYRPDCIWISEYQMQINGKRDNLTVGDSRAYGRNIGLNDKKIGEIIENAIVVVNNWPKYAEHAGVNEQVMQYINGFHKYSDN